MVRHVVYALRCPVTQRIRYVGKTINPKARYRQHISEKGLDTQKKRWIHWLKKQNKLPILEILGTFNTQEEGLVCEMSECLKNAKTVFNLFVPSHTCIETMHDYRVENGIEAEKTPFDCEEYSTDKYNKYD